MLELTAEGALAYACRRGLIGHEGAAARVEKLAGGVSCEVLRIHRPDAEPIVLKQALPKLRVAAEWHSDPARIEREVLVMGLARRALGARHVPEVLDYDPENFIYAMASAPLTAVNWKQELLAGRLDEGLADQCGMLLARFHAIAPEGRDAELLRDKSFFYQLRLEAYLEHSARRAPEVSAELLRLARELEEARLCLTHADYTPKNFLVAGGDLILLDYEVSHLGHGVFDVASILNHFHLKALRDEARRDGFARLSRAFLERYVAEGGPGAGEEILWRCLGGLMLARVVGKSPVEYLNPNQQQKARSTAVKLLRGHIRNLDELD